MNKREIRRIEDILREMDNMYFRGPQGPEAADWFKIAYQALNQTLMILRRGEHKR